jgi:hypothetical protein
MAQTGRGDVRLESATSRFHTAKTHSGHADAVYSLFFKRSTPCARAYAHHAGEDLRQVTLI